MNSAAYENRMAGLDGCGCPMASRMMGDSDAFQTDETAPNVKPSDMSEKDIATYRATQSKAETSSSGDTWLTSLLGKVIEAGGVIGASALAPKQKTTIIQSPSSTLPTKTIMIAGGIGLALLLVLIMSSRQSSQVVPMYVPMQQSKA